VFKTGNYFVTATDPYDTCNTATSKLFRVDIAPNHSITLYSEKEQYCMGDTIIVCHTKSNDTTSVIE
jgi:hypothetical protein